jgi:hypothetical protein
MQNCLRIWRLKTQPVMSAHCVADITKISSVLKETEPVIGTIANATIENQVFFSITVYTFLNHTS